jgi:hypothetical protein
MVGRTSEDPELRKLFDRILVLADPSMRAEEAIAQAPALLRTASAQLGREL